VNRFGLERRRPPPPPPSPPAPVEQPPSYWSTWRATGIVLLQVRSNNTSSPCVPGLRCRDKAGTPTTVSA